jgi:hypothetical protein
MIPVTQTKVVVKDQKGNVVQNGNCYAAAIASILGVSIHDVPNVEVFFSIDASDFWSEIMDRFLTLKGWELSTDDRFKVFHDGNFGLDKGRRADWINELRGKYYFVIGKSPRSVSHICIYKDGNLAHDPHPSKDGLLTEEVFQVLERIRPDLNNEPNVQVSDTRDDHSSNAAE